MVGTKPENFTWGALYVAPSMCYGLLHIFFFSGDSEEGQFARRFYGIFLYLLVPERSGWREIVEFSEVKV